MRSSSERGSLWPSLLWASSVCWMSISLPWYFRPIMAAQKEKGKGFSWPSGLGLRSRSISGILKDSLALLIREIAACPGPPVGHHVGWIGRVHIGRHVVEEDVAQFMG